MNRPTAGHFEPVQFLFDPMKRIVANLVAGPHGKDGFPRSLAPSAMAAAQGIDGKRVCATIATAAVVKPTANMTSPVTGVQLSLRSLRDAS
jgi:hypothetical protein